MNWYTVWASLLKLEFLKNDQGKIGQIRMILMAYSIYLLTIKDITMIHVWALGVLLVAQIGEKIWKYVLDGLRIWKGKENEVS